ncbi:MAG: HU family DNA-binding protein, partial [Actinomycetota bacterium]
GAGREHHQERRRRHDPPHDSTMVARGTAIDHRRRCSLRCRNERGRRSMNKNGLVAEVAKRTGSSKADVARAVDASMDVIRETVARGDRVSLVGFGTFERKRRNKRVARNPRKPETPIVVPARDLPWFIPGKEFKEMIAAKRRRVPARRG